MTDLIFTYTGMIIFGAATVISVLATLFPYFHSKEWYIRVFDYPRMQTFYLALFSFAWYTGFYYHTGILGYFALIALAVIIIIQAYKAFPYTVFASKQVMSSIETRNSDTSIAILICNVLQSNTSYTKLIDRVRQYKPDLLITTETDQKWQDALSVIEKDYPHRIAVPKDNLYGMHLFSAFPLEDAQVRYLISSDYPSIRSRVQLRNKDWIQLFIVHPPPPFPGEADDSEVRDAEIILVGKEAKKETGGVIVAGDFNDVAWSKTTELFQELTGFLDPRRGRGFFNTFHARYPVFRWPLDHTFHSNHFRLIKLKRVKGVDSDHFPIYVNLSFEPAKRESQPETKEDDDTKKRTDEAVETLS